jgi:hypothetical protein
MAILVATKKTITKNMRNKSLSDIFGMYRPWEIMLMSNAKSQKNLYVWLDKDAKSAKKSKKTYVSAKDLLDSLLK